MLRAEGDDVLLAVRVKPRARRSAIAGERAGRLLVEVTAPALEGRANAALCRVIARGLGIAPGRVTVLRGTAARDKLVRIEGITTTEVHDRLAT